MQPPVIVTPPASLPVTLDEAKDYLRVLHSDEDTLILALVTAAVAHVDGWSGILGRCLISQTWRQDYDGFPDDGVMRLPFPDVGTVAVAYTDEAGASQTLAASEYDVASDAIGPRVLIADGGTWPATAATPDAVRITADYGFETVPEDLKYAILLHVGALYKYRESMGEPIESNMTYEALVTKYRRVGI
jgi:uncharacterized phiE125 gp8 family phage protein